MPDAPSLFTSLLLRWFDHYGRKNLPWQKNITPYRVWVSEIMLQQTQVATVIPYFQRFIKQFPTVRQLAAANLDEVLSLWTGLGYYARARHLHQTAKIICTQHKGRFPRDITTLEDLPGIGRSTAGAILAIAFNQPAPILDGNVKRVLTRFHAIAGWPGEVAIIKQLWETATRYTSIQRPAAYTQAIMDLGATVCVRSKPRCPKCPLQQRCLAYQQGLTQNFPYPKPVNKKLPVRKTYLLMLFNKEEEVLLQKRPPTGIWGGLWSFPEINDLRLLDQWCSKQRFSVIQQNLLTSFRHTFSHFHLDIIPVLLKVKPVANSKLLKEYDAQVWYKLPQALKLGLASPIKRLLTSAELFTS